MCMNSVAQSAPMVTASLALLRRNSLKSWIGAYLPRRAVPTRGEKDSSPEADRLAATGSLLRAATPREASRPGTPCSMMRPMPMWWRRPLWRSTSSPPRSKHSSDGRMPCWA
jgi:hypothetical protein